MNGGCINTEAFMKKKICYLQSLQTKPILHIVNSLAVAFDQ